MGRRIENPVYLTLTKHEAEALQKHLQSLVGKGSLSATPSWARRLCGKLEIEIQIAKQLELKSQQS